MNLTLKLPVLLAMGDGGLQKQTAMQVLHTAYNLAQQFQVKEWKDIWKEINGEIPDEMKEPVMSRWECVSEGASNVSENRVQWLMWQIELCTQKNTETTNIQLQVGLPLTSMSQ